MPATPTLTAHAHAHAVHAPAGDLGAAEAAEMELMGAANRDMFSWLLFNSENMTAPALGDHAAHLHAHHAHAHAPHEALAGALDDPFRMLPPADVSLPLALHSASAPLLQAGALTSALPSADAASLQPVGSSSSASATAAAHRRGKKRLAEDAASPHSSSAAGTPTATAAAVPSKAAKGMSATQEGLLRHLESANNALVQKRQAIANAQANSIVPKSEKSGSSGSESPSSLQRKQKLERNRESARECRRRKREHILGVEERCRQLERENMELRGQLKAGKEAMRQEEKEKNRVCEELEQMIQRGASEKELAEKIDNFKEQYSDYGHGRRSALNYHLHQIERLLLPTQVTKMCIWALRQDDSFWQDEEDETSLPVILAKELGLTEEQKKKIQQQRCVGTIVVGLCGCLY